jgi:hypothetical protein
MPKLTWIVASKPVRRLKAALTLQVSSAKATSSDRGSILSKDALPGEDEVLKDVLQDRFLKERKSLGWDAFRTWRGPSYCSQYGKSVYSHRYIAGL